MAHLQIALQIAGEESPSQQAEPAVLRKGLHVNCCSDVMTLKWHSRNNRPVSKPKTLISVCKELRKTLTAAAKYKQKPLRSFLITRRG